MEVEGLGDRRAVHLDRNVLIVIDVPGAHPIDHLLNPPTEGIVAILRDDPGSIHPEELILGIIGVGRHFAIRRARLGRQVAILVVSIGEVGIFEQAIACVMDLARGQMR